MSGDQWFFLAVVFLLLLATGNGMRAGGPRSRGTGRGRPADFAKPEPPFEYKHRDGTCAARVNGEQAAGPRT